MEVYSPIIPKERTTYRHDQRRHSFLRTRWGDMLIMIQVLDPFEQFVTIPIYIFLKPTKSDSSRMRATVALTIQRA